MYLDSAWTSSRLTVSPSSPVMNSVPRASKNVFGFRGKRSAFTSSITSILASVVITSPSNRPG